MSTGAFDKLFSGGILIPTKFKILSPLVVEMTSRQQLISPRVKYSYKTHLRHKVISKGSAHSEDKIISPNKGK